MFSSRPKASETQEDLEKLQDEFNKEKAENKVDIAAKFVGTKQQEIKQEVAPSCANEIEEQIANTFEAIPNNGNVGQIVQKAKTATIILPISFNNSAGFPKAQKRDLNLKNSAGGSIFARSIKKQKTEAKNLEPEVKMETDSVPTQSRILQSDENDSIHQENIRKLQAMSQQEILAEKQRLIDSMDPALIQFLKSRKQKQTSQAATIKQQNDAVQDMKMEDVQTPSEILTQPNSEKWLNFNLIETNKLAWMKNVETPKLDKDQVFEARFDFEGWLLPYSFDEITEENRILYHHGEESGRPGYTLQELFQLSRSNIIQQKIVALNAIANLLSLNSTGVYDGILDLPLEQIFFVLRYCLDDNTPTVLTSSIKAMRNLFHNKIDETCVDCLLGFGLTIQPILPIDNELEDDNTVNDQQLAETNLVKCLARTEILTRIKYIINTMQPNTETIIYCMDILTRMARDNQFILNKVYHCDNLIRSITAHFLPNSVNPPKTSDSPYGLPLLQAIKLLRVLAMRKKQIAEDLVTKHKIMDSVLRYLSSEEYSRNANGLKLQTECLHLWSALIHYDLATDSFRVFLAVLVSLLDYHYKNTDIDPKTTFVRQGHLAALLILIKKASAKTSTAQFGDILEKCAEKWTRQFMNVVDFQCGKLQIISAIVSAAPDALLLQMIKSNGFAAVTKSLKNGSMLLNNYETFKSSPNLRTLECAAWHASEHVVPAMQTDSPLPFLYSVSTCVACSSNTELKLALISHANIKSYFKLLADAKNYHLTSNWFTRVETKFLINVLSISVDVRDHLPDDTSEFYKVAVKTLSVFTADQKDEIAKILANIIFNSKYYPTEVLLKTLSIDKHSQQLETLLQNLDEIRSVYTHVLGLEKDVPKFSQTLSLDHQTAGNVIPIDWIYTPIIVLYSNNENRAKTVDENHQIFTIRNCLRWILIYDTYFPNLATLINATDRFCRIACTFLGSDTLFLVPEIHNLLEMCLKNVLVNCEQQIDFNRTIQGLSNFQDFYTQLLEQYQGVSYGDVLFGNVILVPLAQRHSPKWRKILWSEYAGIVQIFNVTAEQTYCDVAAFLKPEEQDLSLLKCYRRALVSNTLRKHSILYLIAKTHVDGYIEKKKREKNSPES